ncbi:glycosyltransferase family 4 protein [Haladaptatus sp. DYF46]|uniref:glycosyltransferase family 4 protein n=1 Tax=Haladaptatus sp. DYF46 TaxID=2886041 RepID=UPI001E42CFCC|nr:glycosyltransferase family 4 protein [Haladaptatus sp. DYF46]
MHIVVLAEEFYPKISGGALVRWHFCRRAAEQGHDVTVFTPKQDGTPASETVDGVEIRRPLPSKPSGYPNYAPVSILTRVLYSILMLPLVARYLYANEASAVHSTSHALYWTGTVLSKLFRLPHVTFVGYTPSMDSSFTVSPRFVLERVNFRFWMGDVAFCRSPEVKGILEATSSASAEILHGNLQTEQIERVVDGLDANRIRNRHGVAPDSNLVVFVGRLVPIKNPTAIIDIAKKLPPEYEVLVIGDGPEEQAVANKIQLEDLEARVELVGRLPHDETLRTIAAADALLLTSDAEAYPTVVFESLAVNTEVFTTPVGILPHLSHDRLHTGSLNDLPRIIEKSDLTVTTGIDEQTLGRYSMRAYTDRLLTAASDAIE